MLTQFEIQPVLPQTNIDVFVLHVKFEHGDADAITEDSIRVPREDILEVANFYTDCETMAPEDYSDHPLSDRWGMFPCDCTCEDRRAALDSWMIVYHDDEGAKHLVTFK